MTTLRQTKAPNLPLAPVDYLPAYQDQFANVLRLYFNQIDNFTQNINVPAAGVTADRPATSLLVGQFYFDTTLGIPIWYDGINWVDATGATV